MFRKIYSVNMSREGTNFNLLLGNTARQMTDVLLGEHCGTSDSIGFKITMDMVRLVQMLKF